MDAIQRPDSAQGAGAVRQGRLFLVRIVELLLLPLLHQQHHQSRLLRIVQRLFPTHLRSNPHLQMAFTHQNGRPTRRLQLKLLFIHILATLNHHKSQSSISDKRFPARSIIDHCPPAMMRRRLFIVKGQRAAINRSFSLLSCLAPSLVALGRKVLLFSSYQGYN